MKLIFSIIGLLISGVALAQFSFTAKDGTKLENNSKQSISADGKLQFHTFTNYGLKIETVSYNGGGGSIGQVTVEQITYEDILKITDENMPEVKEYKYQGYFYLSAKSSSDNPVYYRRYMKDFNSEIEKRNSIQVYAKGGKAAAQEYLKTIIAKAKEVTSEPGYKLDKSDFAAFGELETKEMNKKVEDELAGLDLDLTSDEEKAAKAKAVEDKEAALIETFEPIYFKNFAGEVQYSVYYVNDKYSSLKTYVYQGDKEKLLYKTYNNVFRGGRLTSSRPDFTNCNYCKVHSVSDENRITIKNVPNSIQYEIIYKNNGYNLVKGTGTNKEQDYDSQLPILCTLDSDGSGVQTHLGKFTIEGYKAQQKQIMYVLAMIYMAGYIENTTIN